MAAYSFIYAGSKVTAQVNVTNLFDRTYYPSEINYTPFANESPGVGSHLGLRISDFRIEKAMIRENIELEYSHV